MLRKMKNNYYYMPFLQDCQPPSEPPKLGISLIHYGVSISIFPMIRSVVCVVNWLRSSILWAITE